MNQMGEAEWKQLSERQQQQRLMELKMKEKQLRKEGKVSEARQLITELVDAERGEFTCASTSAQLRYTIP